MCVKCPKKSCDTWALNRKEINDHYRTVHKNIHKCLRCKKSYSIPHSLKWHYYHHAKKGKQHHCKRCDLSFPFKSQLKIHSMKHTRKPSLKCMECSLLFKYHHDMLKHLKELTAPEISSTSCGYKGTKINLKAYEKQYDPTQIITCTQCKDMFKFWMLY